jgi:hypothetical protein
VRVRQGGSWSEVPSGQVRVGGAWKTLLRIRAYISGAWEDVAVFVEPLTASASPSSVTTTRIGAGPVTTVLVTATPAGGLGPFTYSWARIAGTGGAITLPTNSATTFSRTMGEDEVALNTFRCTVTDSLGNTATADAFVDFISTPTDFS